MTEAIRFYVAVIFNSLSSCLPGNLENRPKILLEVQRAIKNAQELLLMTHLLKYFFIQVERSQESERPDSMVSETSSIRDSVGSFKEWEDYNTALQDVLNWLSKAERTLESQENISGEVDAVKKQFHGHEVNTTSYKPTLRSVIFTRY